MLPDNVFRASAGAVLFDKNRSLIVFERLPPNGTWQHLQGGIDEGEMPEDALFREIFEETAIQKHQLTMLNIYPGWMSYELPKELRTGKHGRGQTQLWFLLQFNGLAEDIKLEEAKDKEFSRCFTITWEESLQRKDDFRSPIYHQLYLRWRDR